jgi:hypothetical protein
MVRMTGSNIIPLTSLMGSAQAGRIGIPVAKSQALYAQFEHVFGVPTEGGVRIDRIKILNTLIDQLSSIKRERGQGMASAPDSKALTPERLDALIGQYQEEIKTAAAIPTGPYRPSVSLPRAIAFSVFA